MSAFVTQDKDGLVTGVKNWKLYHECAKELKVWPDTKLLWDFPFNDLFQQCRDDILHQIDLGMMQHLQTALMSRYTMELHQPFFMEKGIAPGPAGMRRVIQRLCQRIKDANTGLSEYVCQSFLRAFTGLNPG